MIAAVVLAALAQSAAAPGQAAGAAPTGTGDLSFQLLPSKQPALASYLANSNILGDQALQPGALIPSDPLSTAAQDVKNELAKLGLHYLLEQQFNMAAMTRRARGDAVISAYSFELLANWHILESPEFTHTAAWVSMEFEGGSGFGIDWTRQSAEFNVGMNSAPNYGWWSDYLFGSELAWAQSFFDGQLVVVVGQVDQTNYFDLNTYANNSYGQLQNEAFVESKVVPMPNNNLGFNVQWQPTSWLYVQGGIGANNQPAGTPPWVNLSASNLSYLLEIGLMPQNFLGLGPGVYRFQPFYATVNGVGGGGFGFNFQQQLGASSPLGAFGRFGMGSSSVTTVRGASAQAAFGLAMTAPFAKEGLFSATNSDYAAIGFLWDRAAGTGPVYHRNEFGIELTYVMQLTPTLSIQPDLQFLWDPVYGPQSNSTVFQLSLNLKW